LTQLKPYILSFLVALLIGCASSKETVSSSKKSEKVNSSTSALADLPEKEQIKFKFLFHNATKARILGNYQEAVNLFRECTIVAPKESTSYYELAHLFENSKEKELALEFSQKAVDLDPENYWYRIQYAHSLQRNGDSEEAIKQYQTLIKQNGGTIDLYFDLAGMQLYSGKYKESIATFNLIEKEAGITEEISIQKEKIYVKMGDIDNAAKEIEALINEYPENIKHQIELADLYLANDLNEKAFTVCQDILKKDPNNPYANLSLYDYYKQKGEDEKASDALKKTFASSELDIDTKMKILLSYYSATDSNVKKEALDLNRILIKAHPKDAKAYTIYADFLYQDKKLEGAKENYLKALEFDNSKLPIWNQLIFIESELQDLDGLLRDSKAAIELFPNQPLFYFFYGATNLQRKNYTEAVEYLTIGKDYVVGNPPLLAQFYANLGDAHNSLAEYEKSDKSYESALKIDPKNIYVLNNYAYYLSLREEKLDRAEELSALCNELEPEQPNYQDTYAWILYKQGKFIQAKEWLEKAISNSVKPSATILEHLGDTHAKLNNLVKALEYWTQAKDLDDDQGSEFLDKKIADKKLYE
jgi:tetratricopeptide (TPR) repeat protein